MLVKVSSVANVGIETVAVDVEVDVASVGFPGFSIVGLASKAVEESKERVKTAMVNSSLDFPPKKITVNLAPADLPKDGGCYDLPIAVGLLAASGQIPIEAVKGIFYGELSLDGMLRSTKGVLLVGLYASSCQEKSVFVPVESANEAAVVEGIDVYPVRSLRQLVMHLMGVELITKLKFVEPKILIDRSPVDFDFGEIAGQEQAKRACTIAAAGGHNLLLWGPPGTGKTMLARALPGILPTLSSKEALEVTRIYSVSGLLESGETIVRKRPFRAPHHGISAAGMVGGGSNPQPGEVSLSHLGVLFLDEMAEFQRGVLESLRQPMEDGVVGIVRASAHVEYPAKFSLVAAVNPCPCGYLGHPTRECSCTSKQIAKYKSRISGPILDRIDLHVLVGVVEVEKIQSTNNSGEFSEMIRSKVISAREIQQARFVQESIFCNAQMRNKQVKKYCVLDTDGQTLMRTASEKFSLSARSYFRVLKVARTIADIEGSDQVLSSHVAEALQYRQMT